MTTHGTMNPRTKRNFFGLVPFFFRMVQENVDGSRPSVPHIPSNGGNNREKLNDQITINIRMIRWVVYSCAYMSDLEINMYLKFHVRINGTGTILFINRSGRFDKFQYGSFDKYLGVRATKSYSV